MNDLIKIETNEDGQPTISGRELHEFLEVGTPYKDWFPRMCEYGFKEGTDFNPLKFVRVQNEGGREVAREIIDHQITIDMAKELCMIQRTERGKQARQYFIAIEKDWNSPEKIMARALQIAGRKIKELTAVNEQMKPKALFADAVETSDTSILIGDLAKLLKQNGIETGQKRLFERFRNEGFLMRQAGSLNMPTQKAMEMGLFEIKERTINNPDGSIRITKTTKVTGKGQVYFINRFLNERKEGEK